MGRLLRRLLLLVFITALFGAVSYYIITDDVKARTEIYHGRVTLAVETAVAGKKFELTRTAEADQHQYRLVAVGPGEPLVDVAVRYNTTVQVLRTANKLLPNVDVGDGSTIIIPEGVQELIPPRSFTTITAVAGDTLDVLAARYGVTIDQMKTDNPVLTTRDLLPGDVIFVPEIIG